eukprot:7868606-Karenia_brevis.AAC.1
MSWPHPMLDNHVLQQLVSNSKTLFVYMVLATPQAIQPFDDQHTVTYHLQARTKIASSSPSHALSENHPPLFGN